MIVLALAVVVLIVAADASTTQPVAAAPLSAAVSQSSEIEPTLDDIANLEELTGDHANLLRLYWAFFDRAPDAKGALYWIEQHDNCVSAVAIADVFAQSDEFVGRYGQLDERAFVEVIYRNVLGRVGDTDGLDYWTDLLTRRELSKGGVVLNVALSIEFAERRPFPSDEVPSRGCWRPGSKTTERLSGFVEGQSLASISGGPHGPGLSLVVPVALIERAGFHQSTHPGALAMSPSSLSTAPLTTLGSRRRGTNATGAVDIVVKPSSKVMSPVSGTVARAGNYLLYCRYRDGFVVIKPDANPTLELKMLHISDVMVGPGDRVEVGDPVAAKATPLPFRSQIDDLTAEPSWPHVHIEVVDPSIPRKGSGGSC